MGREALLVKKMTDEPLVPLVLGEDYDQRGLTHVPIPVRSILRGAGSLQNLSETYRRERAQSRLDIIGRRPSAPID